MIAVACTAVRMSQLTPSQVVTAEALAIADAAARRDPGIASIAAVDGGLVHDAMMTWMMTHRIQLKWSLHHPRRNLTVQYQSKDLDHGARQDTLRIASDAATRVEPIAAGAADVSIDDAQGRAERGVEHQRQRAADHNERSKQILLA